ncbi:295_t:CDS:2, partial [Funneliformis mosseae]
MDDFYKPPYSSAASTIPPVPPHPASLGNVEVVKILMNANVNVESCNRENAASLIIAAYNGHADVCCEPTDHGVPGRFLTTIPQHPIEKNILIQNIYPEIPINNTKGYLMSLNRKDSRRTIIQPPHLTPSVLFSLAVTACFCNPCLFTI